MYSEFNLSMQLVEACGKLPAAPLAPSSFDKLRMAQDAQGAGSAFIESEHLPPKVRKAETGLSVSGFAMLRERLDAMSHQLYKIKSSRSSTQPYVRARCGNLRPQELGHFVRAVVPAAYH